MFRLMRLTRISGCGSSKRRSSSSRSSKKSCSLSVSSDVEMIAANDRNDLKLTKNMQQHQQQQQQQ